MGDIAKYFLPTLAVVAATIWGFILIRAWMPAAKARGGLFHLEALLIIAGPAVILANFLALRKDAVGSLSSTAGIGLAAMGAGLSLMAFMLALRSPRRKVGWIVFAVSAYYAALILSCFVGVEFAFPPVYWITPMAVLAFVIQSGYTTQWLLRTALLCVRVVVLLSFAAIFIQPELSFNTEEARTFFGISRLAGIVGHPNGLAAVAAVGLLLEIRAGRRLMWKLLFVAALLLAQSSTGYAVAVGGIAILLLHKRPAFRWLLWAGAISFGVGMMLFPNQTGSVVATVIPENAATFTGRTRVWAAAMQGFYQNPVFGYGPELLGEQFRAYYIPGANFATHAHNQFIQTLAGQGVVGAVSLGLLIIVLLAYAFKTRNTTDGLGLALVAFVLLRCASETPLKPSGIALGTFIIVLVVGLLASAEEHPKEPGELLGEKPRPAGSERTLALANNQPRA
ncbi:O-antigen ligase [Paenarthrobacter nicotinovorans]|uniref:O-antigen ligase n=1 Tax=Paenarthrobacter nicotinovorans TaxID=29320 RepID=A0ABT9TFM0_PAENI|nr:O-antigen ligase family protein [Paenarthrobacter nicotinovorans]MDQ0100430.1 O-antigen ligase [Paenarthrobacter nicotinovorans]